MSRRTRVKKTCLVRFTVAIDAAVAVIDTKDSVSVVVASRSRDDDQHGSAEDHRTRQRDRPSE